MKKSAAYTWTFTVVKFSTGGSPPGAPVKIVKEVDQSFSLMCMVVLKTYLQINFGVFVTYYVVKNFLSCSLPLRCTLRNNKVRKRHCGVCSNNLSAVTKFKVL